jgi:hypothetical protein
MIQDRVGSQEDRDERELAGIGVLVAVDIKVSVITSYFFTRLTSLYLSQLRYQGLSRIRRVREDSDAAQSVSIFDCTEHRTDMLHLPRVRTMRTQLAEHETKQSRSVHDAVLLLLRFFQLLIQAHVAPGLRDVRASRPLTVTGTIAVHNATEKVQEKTEVLVLGHRIHRLQIVRLDDRSDGFNEASQPSRSVDGIVFAWVLIESQHDGLQTGAHLKVHEQGPFAVAHCGLQVVEESLVARRFGSYNVQETAVNSGSVGRQIMSRLHRMEDLLCLVHARFVVFKLRRHQATWFCDGKNLPDFALRIVLIIAVITVGVATVVFSTALLP